MTDPFGWPPVYVGIRIKRQRWYGWTEARASSYFESKPIGAWTRKGLIKKARRAFPGHTHALPWIEE